MLHLEFYLEPLVYLDSSVSSILRPRTELNLAHGVPLKEIGNSAISLFASTTNAIPTMFWVILYIFSNLAQVFELRNSLERSKTITFIKK
jgi:hypothetical protein